MSIAREHFLGRIEALKAILDDSISTDSAPVPAPNSAAVAVRNGCMVMLFCALEGFIRARSLECARAIDQTAVPYSHLPTGLKVASLISTFEGLLLLSRGLTTADKIIEFEKAAIATATGSLGSSYQFTEYSFGRDKSNVIADDIPKIAKAFGVENFWTAARVVATKAGVAIPGNMDDLFKQIARERHRAAHVSAHNVPHSLLKSSLPDAIVLCLTFDTLISRATDQLSKSLIARGAVPPAVNGTHVDFIVIKPHTKANWAAFSPSRSRALFVETSLVGAIGRAVPIARAKSLDVICLDSAGRPADWRSAVV